MPLDRRLFEGKLQSSIVYPEFFPLHPTDRVVNLGCGVGPQVVAYRGQFAHMTCVDLSEDRLEQLRTFATEYGVDPKTYRALCAPVENTGLPPGSFQRALAIDIIEHLIEPMLLLQEIHRLLVPGGSALVTIPVLHDRYTALARGIGRILGRAARESLPVGHADRHNSDLSRKQWLRVFTASPLKLVAVRATTLWPPLHLYGVPRFWFTNRAVHAIDRTLCRLPGLRSLGQAWMCILEKPPTL